MTVYKPSYYDDFYCIADKCDYTCCMQWNISVDGRTKEKWKKTACPEGMEEGMLSDYVIPNMGYDSIKHNKDGRCPFLNEKGLCRIVLKYGEDMIPDTCHNFPRERQEFSDRVELFLSVGCKSVLKLLWEEDCFTVLKYNDSDEEISEDASDTPKLYFEIRDWMLGMAKDETLSPMMALKEIFYLLLDLNEMYEAGELTEENYEDYSCSEVPYELEETLLEMPDEEPDEDRFLEGNELLLDVFDKYLEQGIYLDIIKPVAEHAEKIEYDATKLEIFLDEIWRPMENRIRVLLCEEIYASMLTPHSAFTVMVEKTEWIAMEFAVLRQWMYLFWDMNGKLEEEDILQITATLFRIMGYCDEDILEYLSNSFESEIWDFGYINLII